MDKDVRKIILDIIQTEMILPSNYGLDKKKNVIPSLLTSFNNAALGKTKKLQVIATQLNFTPTSNNSKTDFTVDPPMEKQTVVGMSSIQIDLISKNSDAETRNWEVLAALESVYSVQQQEKYKFRIFKMPSGFSNTSAAEGSSNLNRYTIVVNCHIWFSKEKELTDYYSYFRTRADNEDTAGEVEGMIEFEEGAPAP